MIKGRSFLKLLDFTKDEIQYLIDLSKKLKKDKKNGIEKKTLEGKNIALIFEKTSTRTRCAFEVAAFDQGANVSYIGPSSSQIGDKESMEDTAKVLGRFYDGIEYRGYGQEVVEILSEHSGVPVWNGLTTEFHPTQILADFLTILEKKGKLKGIKLAYVGDGRNNMANSLMIGAAKFGMDFRIVAPKELFPRKELAETAIKIAEKTKGRIFFTDDRIEGVKDADVIYTDVWVSMGETKEVWKERIERLSYYQVNSELVKHAKSDYIFMHCLPAFHDLNTKVAKEIEKEYGIKEMEVTDEIFRSENSVVFDEAENRMHTIKAVMVATLGDREYPL
ncbi:MAG: ornithine carbamoyltransferase [Leptotrichiaceae bacterium]|nr:ornithine carbamoyltransferase [Leptotrichiaceae bacterium]MBP6281391.1 ornithine carbamoyltransferase [Leptotrichiaceae bacterium]MBP7101543.1 ornithine carbamoyltransferase [Leptotrichiaceae bacterium]MBP7725162.1 ornithine carbamoyltransferase [Leptotrichiaceae bacterium]MBP9629155.1 ornithine carbamoyltransferase [Leptotrichiaceae bacterium]